MAMASLQALRFNYLDVHQLTCKQAVMLIGQRAGTVAEHVLREVLTEEDLDIMRYGGRFFTILQILHQRHSFPFQLGGAGGDAPSTSHSQGQVKICKS